MNPNATKKHSDDSQKLLILIIATIFGVELLLMVVFMYFIQWQMRVAAVLVAVLLLSFVFRSLTGENEERRQAEERLKASEMKYSTLVEQGNDGILILQDDGILKYGNSIISNMTGYTLEETIGKQFLGYVCPEYRVVEAERYKKRIQGQDVPARYEIEILSKTGEKTPVEISASRIEYEGKPAIMAIVRDVTDRKKAEKKLEDFQKAIMNVLEDLRLEKDNTEKERAKDEAILASIGDGLIITDDTGVIIHVNEKFEKVLGWTAGEVIGKNMVDVVPKVDENGEIIPPNKRSLSRVLSGEIPAGRVSTIIKTHSYIRKDKSKVPVIGVVTPVILDNKIIGAVQIFRDITYEQEIDKAKTEFVSLASHQLRTPLSTIGWYTEMLLSGDAGALTEMQKQYLEEVYEGNRRMVELVNSLLNVSRIETGSFGIEPKTVVVKDIVDNVLKDLSVDLQEKKLVVETTYDDVTSIDADPKLLRMIFQNILSNAQRYTPAGGSIQFHASRRPTEILFTVRDTGIGIPASSREKIFMKLYRADNAQSIQPNGTGLGLYMVKSILDHAGGRIWFESEEGKGSTFYVTIPLEGMKKKESAKGLV